jgi:drug/metabolite transporter (DMT)-like permease
VLLVLPDAMHEGIGGPMLRGFLILQFGAATWSLGSICQRRVNAKAHPVVSGAVQQLATGLVYLGPALFWHSRPIAWSNRSAGAVLYLVIFGSLIGYSAFIYALIHLPVSVVTIYNYVNPIVALLLGWAIYKEAISTLEIAAMAIIFVGVALVKHYAPQPAPAKPGAARAPKRARAAVDS